MPTNYRSPYRTEIPKKGVEPSSTLRPVAAWTEEEEEETRICATNCDASKRSSPAARRSTLVSFAHACRKSPAMPCCVAWRHAIRLHRCMPAYAVAFNLRRLCEHVPQHQLLLHVAECSLTRARRVSVPQALRVITFWRDAGEEQALHLCLGT